MKISINNNNRKLLDSRGFIYFQNKKVLSIEEFTKLGSYLGKPRKINYLKCHKKYKFINILKRSKKEKRKNFFGDIWHSDHAFEINPPRYTVLLCKKISSIGNLTYFINRNELFRKLGKKNQNFIRKNYFKIDAPLNFKKNVSEKYNKKIRQSIKGASKNNYGYKINISPYHNSFFDYKNGSRLKNIFKLFKPQYKIKWQKNMILIWNNEIVFHKASKVNADRLMYRMIIDEKKK